MAAGKTTELIRRLRTAEQDGQKCLAFKPKKDTRYAKDKIVPHDHRDEFPCRRVLHPVRILLTALVTPQVRVVAVDEVNLFGSSARALPLVAKLLARTGRRVILAGLDTDMWCRPYEWLARLRPSAERTVLTAICRQCGKTAHFSQFLGTLDGRNRRRGADCYNVGGLDRYEPRCAGCHRLPRGCPSEAAAVRVA